MIHLILFTKQKETHRLREQVMLAKGNGWLGSLGWTCTCFYISNG